ncbi:MAG: hydrolase [Lachnospiraceae bacterium]|nr:hydrolase [Lachnospiraceae bacterium]
MKIKREEAVALFVDYQERLVPAMAHKEALMANSVKLAKGLTILEVPHLVSQQYTKGLGQTVAEIREALGDDAYLEKMSFSCLEEDYIREAVAATGKNTVIVCGIESHVCVQQSVLDLLELGYGVVVVADCVDSRKDYDREIALERMRSAGAIITTCEALLYELTNRAGDDRFRAISKLTK